MEEKPDCSSEQPGWIENEAGERYLMSVMTRVSLYEGVLRR